MFSPLNGRRAKRLALLLFLLFLFYSVYTFFKLPPPEFMDSNIHTECKLPNIDPFDKSITKYIFHPEPLRCSLASDLTYIDKDDGLLHLNSSACQNAGYSAATMNCSYQSVYRTNEDDDHVSFRDPVYVLLPAEIPDDFFVINCKDINGRRYKNLHAHASRKTFENTKLPAHCPSNPYNILIFGLDSVSRLNALRKLPKTYRYLTKTLGAFDFKGYTKIGTNTFPNVVAFLTGKYTSEIKKTPPGNVFYDGYPLLWKNFSDCHYVTMFSEDSPEIGTFNYVDKGFYKQPTDHYMRPFWLSFGKYNPVNDFLAPVWLLMENQKVRLAKTSNLCHGSIPKYMLVVNYYLSFIRRYHKKMPMFSMSWISEICHDYLNMVEVGDESFYNFIKTLNEEGFLKNSFFFFVSDHGHRFDWFRRTLIGRIEDKMPIFVMLAPEKFKTEHPDIARNLQRNTEYLVSPFDTHQTFKDIFQIHFDSTPPKQQNNEVFQPISFFKPIPNTRTCAQAGIPQHFCACYQSTEVDHKDKIVSVIANFVLEYTNALTENWRKQCAKFKLTSVLNVQKQIPTGSLNLKKQPEFLGFRWTTPEEPVGLYIISMEVSPGAAIFESTINIRSSDSMEILGEVYRINRYGNQSFCMTEKTMKSYCYCV